MKGIIYNSTSKIEVLPYKSNEIYKSVHSAPAGGAHGLSAGLQTKGPQVQFPVRAHAWGAG